MRVKLSNEAKQRIGAIRKGFTRKDFKREGKGIPLFATPEMVKHEMATGIVQRIPGKQNKHHGTKPGSYKHKRHMIRKARRANRS